MTRRCASASRPSGQWRDDDYDVLENGVVVGRIFLSAAAPRNRPWMWASGHNGEIRAQRMGMRLRAKLRWRRSLRAGAEARREIALSCPLSGKPDIEPTSPIDRG